MLEFLSNNLISNIVFAIVGGFLSWFFSRKYSSRRQLGYKVETMSVLNEMSNPSNHKGLSIRFGQKDISELYKSRIMIKNNSPSNVLKRDDIPSKNPLAIKCKDGEILQIIPSESNKDSFNALADLQDDNMSANIIFEYIDSIGYIEYEVLHTKREIDIVGSIIGATKKQIKESDSFKLSIAKSFSILDIIVFVNSICFILVIIAASLGSLGVLFNITMFVYIISIIAMIWASVSRIHMFFRSVFKK